MPKLIVMLRIKNGLFFLSEWLKNMELLTDEIVVVDNGSTDGTYEILKAHPKVTSIERTEGFNEGRDKNLMYQNARKRNPDWCLWMDVDEIFEPEFTRAHLNNLMSNRFINKYGFRRFHFIDRENFAGSWYRLNYSSGHDRLLWRESPSGYFENLVIDSPNVKGIGGIQKNTGYRIKHLGYINKDIVDKKADIYRSVVPEKEATFQSMYLVNERKIKWQDQRKSLKVTGLNMLLNYLQLANLFKRGFKKITALVRPGAAVQRTQQA